PSGWEGGSPTRMRPERRLSRDREGSKLRSRHDNRPDPSTGCRPRSWSELSKKHPGSRLLRGPPPGGLRRRPNRDGNTIRGAEAQGLPQKEVLTVQRFAATDIPK